MGKLTLDERLFVRSFRRMASEYMRDPAHRAAFEEWQAKRHGAQTATNETRAMPAGNPGTGTVAPV